MIFHFIASLHKRLSVSMGDLSNVNIGNSEIVESGDIENGNSIEVDLEHNLVGPNSVWRSQLNAVAKTSIHCSSQKLFGQTQQKRSFSLGPK